jgi:hypothetical protein
MALPAGEMAPDDDWTPESAAYAARAAAAGLTFASRIEPVGGAIPAEAVRRGLVAWCRDGTLAIAPEAGKMAAIAAWLARHPRFARRIKVTTPSEIRRALIAANATGFAHIAVNALQRRHPELSARGTVSMSQAVVLIAAGTGAAYALINDPFRAVAEAGAIATLFFLAMSLVRFAAARAIRKAPAASLAISDPTPDHALPTYTILVPLCREAAMVRNLIGALRRIDWPGIR